ncbi:hypothetical protein Acr_10g0010290 [Actinidia rufa]|uniref:Uncharacterized protein n=1 Tax=Actinidia rufa TaxID=165716 RepID=A0A7J0FAB3_9ERIC|nr:hypothetical protein Acr_10g0010290 [Actinidia rufa]
MTSAHLALITSHSLKSFRNPSIDTRSLPERETNIMTQGEPRSPAESCSFPVSIQIRLPKVDETIAQVFGIFNNPKLDFGWLYFKARPKRTLLRGYPINVKRQKKKFFFIAGDNWEFAHGQSQELEVPKVPRLWSTPDRRCNVLPALNKIEQERFNQILDTPEQGQFYSIKVTYHIYDKKN